MAPQWWLLGQLLLLRLLWSWWAPVWLSQEVPEWGGLLWSSLALQGRLHKNLFHLSTVCV